MEDNAVRVFETPVRVLLKRILIAAVSGVIAGVLLYRGLDSFNFSLLIVAALLAAYAAYTSSKLPRWRTRYEWDGAVLRVRQGKRVRCFPVHESQFVEKPTGPDTAILLLDGPEGTHLLDDDVAGVAELFRELSECLPRTTEAAVVRDDLSRQLRGGVAFQLPMQFQLASMGWWLLPVVVAIAIMIFVRDVPLVGIPVALAILGFGFAVAVRIGDPFERVTLWPDRVVRRRWFTKREMYFAAMTGMRWDRNDLLLETPGSRLVLSSKVRDFLHLVDLLERCWGRRVQGYSEELPIVISRNSSFLWIQGIAYGFALGVLIVLGWFDQYGALLLTGGFAAGVAVIVAVLAVQHGVTWRRMEFHPDHICIAYGWRERIINASEIRNINLDAEAALGATQYKVHIYSDDKEYTIDSQEPVSQIGLCLALRRLYGGETDTRALKPAAGNQKENDPS